MNCQKELEEEIKALNREKEVPRLLLHSCCAPCSSYVLEYLSEYFEITVFYYNPNIYPASEYERRVREQKKLIADMPVKRPVSFTEGKYEREKFLAAAKGYEDAPEGGERCLECYRLRLREAAREAAKGGFDRFTTTLSISPLKKADDLNEIGEKAGEAYGVKYLKSDFKKKNGFGRSVELSAKYGLYRQDYCGCEYSLRDRREKGNQRYGAAVGRKIYGRDGQIGL